MENPQTPAVPKLTARETEVLLLYFGIGVIATGVGGL